MSLIQSHDDLFAFAERERERYEDLLKAFVEVPVSSEPDRQRDIKRGVELAKETIRSFGGKVGVHRTNGGNPIIHGIFDNGKNCPTVTVYNHLDVQPASQETEPWKTDPFVMARKGDRYFGRGTTDDKGPALRRAISIHAKGARLLEKHAIAPSAASAYAAPRCPPKPRNPLHSISKI